MKDFFCLIVPEGWVSILVGTCSGKSRQGHGAGSWEFTPSATNANQSEGTRSSGRTWTLKALPQKHTSSGKAGPSNDCITAQIRNWGFKYLSQWAVSCHSSHYTLFKHKHLKGACECTQGMCIEQRKMSYITVLEPIMIFGVFLLLQWMSMQIVDSPRLVNHAVYLLLCIQINVQRFYFYVSKSLSFFFY
jgi:hypothetical protein